MIIAVVNTSPEKERGSVSLLLDPYLEGMKAAGAEVDIYYSRDLIIFPCCGNLNCTVQTPGRCMACDDMRWLRQKISQADVLVLASPLYFDGRTGPEGATPSLRMLLDRLVPGAYVSDFRPYEHAIHTTRETVNLRKVVVVSGCGFWEIDGLFPVLTHLKALCYNTFPEFAGHIVEPRGVMLRGAVSRGMLDRDLIGVAREAGCQLADEDRAPPDSYDLVRREAVTRDFYGRITKNGMTQATYRRVVVREKCAEKEV